MTLAETITKLMQTAAPSVRLFEYTELKKEPGKSSAVLKVIGMPAMCPHCSAEVPPNHGHACTRKHIGGKWVWTRSNTPL
jgi:hypothetical protein